MLCACTLTHAHAHTPTHTHTLTYTPPQHTQSEITGDNEDNNTRQTQH